MTYNNYIKLLLYLKQFEGDGLYYDIENVLENMKLEQQVVIFKELADEKLIDLIEREQRYYTFLLERNIFTGQSKITENPLNELIDKTKPMPWRAKITLKGSKYLKEELQMQESGKYTFNFHSPNSMNNLAIESKYISFNNNSRINENIDKIIETLKSDSTIDEHLKTEALEVFEKVKIDGENGRIEETLYDKILNYGDKISSIASFVMALLSVMKSS